jgi:hypothetical protein
MLKKLGSLAIAAAVLSLFIAPAHAANAVQQYSASVSATQTNSAVTFTDQSAAAFSAYTVTVVNDGGDDIYVNFSSTTATAGTNKEVQLKSGESYTANRIARDGTDWVGFSGIGVICATGKTATARVTALR